MNWQTTVVTLFPEMFPGPLSHSLAGKALNEGLWSLDIINIRNFATDKHKTVDDTCFGGGGGMIMMPEVVHKSLLHSKSLYEKHPKIIYLSPKGRNFKQKDVKNFISKGCVFLCGRYEGVDERVIEHWKKHEDFEEISIGDYILSGGEIAAMTIIDACVRWVPGVVVNTESLKTESFELELLEFPQYTKPRCWMGYDVPEILFSGHHENIRNWRLEESKRITKERRPDIIKGI